MDETAALRVSRPVGLGSRRNRDGPPDEMIAAEENTQTCSVKMVCDYFGKRGRSRRRLHELLREMPRVVEGLVLHIASLMRVALTSKTYCPCIWLQVFAVDFKWAEQFKRLDIQLQECSLFRDHLPLRGYKYTAFIAVYKHFSFRSLSVPSEVNYHTNKHWSILAGSQHTLILFIHLQSLSSFLIHSFHSPLAPLIGCVV